MADKVFKILFKYITQRVFKNLSKYYESIKILEKTVYLNVNVKTTNIA